MAANGTAQSFLYSGYGQQENQFRDRSAEQSNTTSGNPMSYVPNFNDPMYGTQQPDLGRYAPPMYNPNTGGWSSGQGGYAYNLPTSFGPYGGSWGGPSSIQGPQSIGGIQTAGAGQGGALMPPGYNPMPPGQVAQMGAPGASLGGMPNINFGGGFIPQLNQPMQGFQQPQVPASGPYGAIGGQGGSATPTAAWQAAHDAITAAAAARGNGGFNPNAAWQVGRGMVPQMAPPTPVDTSRITPTNTGRTAFVPSWSNTQPVPRTYG